MSNMLRVRTTFFWGDCVCLTREAIADGVWVSALSGRITANAPQIKRCTERYQRALAGYFGLKRTA